MNNPISNALYEALAEAETSFAKATTYSEQHFAASAWLSIAELLEERGEMEVEL